MAYCRPTHGITGRTAHQPMEPFRRRGQHMRSVRVRLGWLAVVAGLVAAGTAPALAEAPGPAVSALAWPAFLKGPAHSSYNATQLAITPANAASLVQKWNFVGDQPTMPGQPAPGFVSSPTVAEG